MPQIQVMLIQLDVHRIMHKMEQTTLVIQLNRLPMVRVVQLVFRIILQTIIIQPTVDQEVQHVLHIMKAIQLTATKEQAIITIEAVTRQE